MRGLQGDEADLLTTAKGDHRGGAFENYFLRILLVDVSRPRGVIEARALSTLGTRGDWRLQVEVPPALNGCERHSHWRCKLVQPSTL